MSDPTRIDSNGATRLDDTPIDGKTRVDTPAPGLARVGIPVLPSALANQYQIVEAFHSQGAEADLYLVEHITSTSRFVLKLYRRGLRPKEEVMEAIRACERRHVVEIVTWGESDGLWYDILEYAKHGTLRNLLQDGPVKAEVMFEVARELSASLDHIHRRKIVHRDLKPENVLLRSVTPLNLILTDFGIASISDATQHFTTKNRTIKYGAPEAAAGAVGNASDYWSLGLIIIEGLTGKHPFDGLSDHSVALQLVTRSVDISAVKDPRWHALCLGLLNRDPKKRWGADQLKDWLAGKMPEVVPDEIERPSQKPYKILGRQCWTAPELALELARNWSEGEKHIARGLVLPWLRDELRDQDAANLLIDLRETRAFGVEDRLLRLIVGLGKGLPPIWRGISLDQNTLISLCKDAVNDNSGAAGLISDMFEKRVLEVWASGGNQECAQWHLLWTEAASALPQAWKQTVDAASLTKTLPGEKNYLPVLLLQILSPQYRENMEREVAAHSESLARCHWLTEVRDGNSYHALLTVFLLITEATATGNAEIEAAARLSRAIKDLEQQYAEKLNADAGLKAELEELKKAIPKNRAAESLYASFPTLREKLFNAAKVEMVAQSFRQLKLRFWTEMIFDGLLVSSLIVLVRFWLGAAVSDDGWGFLAARIGSIAENPVSIEPYLFGMLGVTALVWIALRVSARRLAKALFGK